MKAIEKIMKLCEKFADLKRFTREDTRADIL